jgi:hypothetical protein
VLDEDLWQFFSSWLHFLLHWLLFLLHWLLQIFSFTPVGVFGVLLALFSLPLA